MDCCRNFLSRLGSRKQLSNDDLNQTPLRRTLNTFQLTVMGMGAMMGSGLYVLTGVEAKEVTGPAIVLSYVLASVASILAALCYVEFACRVPKTGSAYTFAYIGLGEIWAFVIGWDLVLEYVITAAALATAVTGYLDSLLDNAMRNATVNGIMHGELWDVPYLAPYPNIFAPIVVILVMFFIVTGAKVSSWITTICMLTSMAVISVIVVMGFMNADIHNWQDYGGFIPNGPASIVAGAATLFFSFVGFDAIAMANEESVDPRKSIPWATFFAILIVSICYILASAVLTLVVPYTELDVQSAFASAFQVHGIEWVRWFVGVGAICSMFSALVMNLYCVPRSLYAMASDGLFFECLSTVNSYTNVPIYATLLATFFVIVPATLISLSELVEFISIGVLLGYSFVAGAVIFLRYGPDNITTESIENLHMKSFAAEGSVEPNVDDNSALLDTMTTRTPGTLIHRFRSTPILRELARFEPGVVVKISLLSSVILLFCAVAIIEHGIEEIPRGLAIILIMLFSSGSISFLLLVPLHYQNEDKKEYYRVPFVPIFPWLSILCNVVLLLKLRAVTWLRYLVWLIVGLTIYMTYGYRHSKVGRGQRGSPSPASSCLGNESNESGATYGSTK